VQLIKDLFEKSSIYVKNEASEEKVKKGLSGFNILHLATHGKMKANIKESHHCWRKQQMVKRTGCYFSRKSGVCPLRDINWLPFPPVRPQQAGRHQVMSW